MILVKTGQYFSYECYLMCITLVTICTNVTELINLMRFGIMMTRVDPRLCGLKLRIWADRNQSSLIH